jgi:hypothetical protein
MPYLSNSLWLDHNFTKGAKIKGTQFQDTKRLTVILKVEKITQVGVHQLNINILSKKMQYQENKGASNHKSKQIEGLRKGR